MDIAIIAGVDAGGEVNPSLRSTNWSQRRADIGSQTDPVPERVDLCWTYICRNWATNCDEEGPFMTTYLERVQILRPNRVN